ncbi:MAG: oligosaccharide flippase family protein [Clostridiales bacterium]|jgi:stage V sporulation protein B|nr:oligosaccharide flippase family protein [Clostridiales bacterium]
MKKSVFQAVALVSVLSIVTRVLSFVFKIYLSRAYGADAVGLYQIGISIFFLFAAFPASGLPLAVSRRVAEITGDGNERKEFSLVSSAAVVGLLISAAVTVVFFAFPKIFNLMFADKRVIPIFQIMLPALFSTTVYCVLRGWFWGRKRFLVFGFTELLEEVFRIVFSVLFAGGVISAVNGATGIALAFLVSDAASALTLALLYFIKGGRFTAPRDIKTTVKSAAPITAMRVFGNIVGSLSAVIIPQRLVAAGVSATQATAEYGRVAGMAIPLLLAPLALIGSIAVVLIPELASDKKANPSLLSQKINRSLSASVLITGLFLAVYLPFGKEIGVLLYNDAAAGLYLRFSAILMLPIGINQIGATVLNSIGLEGKSFLSFILGTALMIVLVFFLPKYIGIYAVAVGTGACYTVTSVMNLRLMKKHIGMSLAFLKTTVLAAAFCGPTAFIAVWLRNIAASVLNETVATVLCMAVAALLYLTLVWCFDLVDIQGFLKKRNNSTSSQRAKRKKSVSF